MFKNEPHADVDTTIGPSVHVEGDLKSQGNIHIDGSVDGSVTTSGHLTIGEQARISASVQAGNAQVAGYVKGNLTVTERLELSPTSHVEGDVSAKVLVVAEGAQLNGRCQMGASLVAANANGGVVRSKKEKLATAES